MWDLIASVPDASVPDHCLSFYFSNFAEITILDPS